MSWSIGQPRDARRQRPRVVLFLEPLEDRTLPALFGFASTFGTGNNPAVVAVGDFNGDNNPDLAISNQDSGSVSVLANNGAGAFPSTLATVVVGGTPEGLAAGDFNGDNKLDLAAANLDGNLNLLLGNGNGSFLPPVNLDLSAEPSDLPVFVAVGDFNLDGNLDMAVAQFGANTVTLLQGNDPGTPTILPTPLGGLFNPEQVVVADFDADGRPDLAVPSQGGTSGISVYLNTTAVGTENPGITFNPTPVRVNSGLAGASASHFGCTGLATADFDGDGRMDLAVTNFGDTQSAPNVPGQTVSVFRNTTTTPGNLSFADALNLTVGTNPVGVTVGDFNADQRPDLAVANNQDGGRISVLLSSSTGAGNLGFRTPTHFPVGARPQILASVALDAAGLPRADGGRSPDLNGDLRADLAVAVQNGTNNVAVLLNRARTTTTLGTSGSPSSVGQSVTFTATVAADFVDAVVPSGTVTFRDGGAFLGTGNVSPLGVATFSTSQLSAGNHAITATYDGDANYAVSMSATVPQVVNAAAPPRIIVAPDQGGPPRVRVFDTAGNLTAQFDAYGTTFQGGVRVAAADITGDGTPEIFTAPGPTGAPFVNIFDGVSFALLRQFQVYGTSFTLGVNLAVGNVVGDGRPEIVVAPERGGQPFINVLDSDTGQLVQQFLAYGEAFTGGVRIALANTDAANGALLEVLTAPQAGGAPFVNQFNAAVGATTNPFIRQHQVYGPTFTGGIFLAGGAVNSTGLDDFIVGPGSGGDPFVNGFDGTTGDFIKQVQAYGLEFKAGVRVALADVNGDGTSDIITGPGPGGQPFVQLVNGSTQRQILSFLAFEASMTAGLFVVTTR